MGSDVWSVFAFFAALPFAFAGWGYCWYQALRRITPDGEVKGPRALMRFNGVNATSRDFTAAGWRYRWAALACLGLPPIAFVVARVVLRG